MKKKLSRSERWDKFLGKDGFGKMNVIIKKSKREILPIEIEVRHIQVRPYYGYQFDDAVKEIEKSSANLSKKNTWPGGNISTLRYEFKNTSSINPLLKLLKKGRIYDHDTKKETNITKIRKKIDKLKNTPF